MKRYAVIVAGGKGLRMGNDIPKQFLLLQGRPILMHSIDAFYSYDSTIQCIVVLPEQQVPYWKELCIKHNFTTPHTIVFGGKERFYSVKNGVFSITTDGVVAVHDGVRPLLSKELLDAGFTLAEQTGSAVPFVDSIDSLRIIDGGKTQSVDRSVIKRIQTPQIFDIETLKKAMNQEYTASFTDEASVWEQFGKKLFFYPGSTSNIKITTPTDLAIAEIFLNKN